MAQEHTRPAAPDRCARRPRQAGLVVPFVTYVHAGATAFGVLDPERRAFVLLEWRCQICGQPLTERSCIIVRPQDERAGYVAEPALHPECFAYSRSACPVLNGTQDHHRDGAAQHPAFRRCDDPGCRCRRIAAADEIRCARPVDQYDCWIVDTSAGYRVAFDPGGGPPLGLDLRVPVLRKRPIRPSAAFDGEEFLARVRDLLDLEQPHT